MDSSVKYNNPSPRLTANPLNKLIFWWLKSLFQYGKSHDLEVKDLKNALDDDLSEPLGDILEKHWKDEQTAAHDSKRPPKLLTAIRKTFAWSYSHYGIAIFILVCIRMLIPYVLKLLIQEFNPNTNHPPERAYILATAMVLLSLASVLLEHHSNLGQWELGMRLRIACSSLVYRKSLRLSRYSAEKAAGGQIINLLSNDVIRFDLLFFFLHYIWVMPIQGAVMAYLIWESVGIATLAGISLITIQTIPLQGYLGKLTSKFRAKIAVRTDERVRLMSEIIHGIQVIKMYTWEKPFQELVSQARKYEIDVLKVTSYLRGINRATFVYTERTTLYFTIMAFVLGGNEITADIVFSMAQYFNRLQCTMAIFFPIAITSAAEALVSVKRLEKFLLLEEHKPAMISEQNIEKTGAISIKGASASWVNNSITNTLHDISVKVEPGALCALVGPVGSGKSSFLQLILGELQPNRGHVDVSGKISYASQEPWLFGGSVRNNILFGQPYNETRYQRVIHACALLKDFIQLPQGDKTLVGERGASLSGGQRARINLARAIYRDAEIYLLDDPLSAVDPHVAKSLFEECIKGFLADKTRILVTHQVQYLKDVDLIIMLNNGIVEKQGTFEDFNPKNLENLCSTENEGTGDSMQIIDNPDNDLHISKIQDTPLDEPRETEELITKGKLATSLYTKYFRAGGSIVTLMSFALIAISSQFASSGTDYWVKFWTTQTEERVRNNVTFTANNINADYMDNSMALWIYGGCIAACVILTTLRNVVFYKICMNASRNLHNTMFGSLLKAPMRFFNTHPSGQILNRFSKDVGCVDELLPMAMIDTLQTFSVMIGIFGQVIIIRWWIIFPIIVMTTLYWLIRSIYMSTAQDLKRLEGVTKSPVFTHVNASLAGLATIRAAGGQEMIKKEFDSYQNVHTGAYSLIISTSVAFGLWLDIVTISFVAFVSYSFIYYKDDAFAGSVGLVLSQILVLCGMMQYGMRQTAEMVAQMTSVERILEFTELEQEGPFESTANKKPLKEWPVKGQIEFKHVYLRYADGEKPVLRDLNLIIEPGMKVGIVGRTGAGKSSLISALFNLAKLEGDIFIDNINTKSIGLHDLRHKLSIIPQEPMLFSASLRENLDPFHDYDDAALWSALEEVELKSSVSSLDHLVSSGGGNFSAGQRQLLCLARAIVRNNRILVLDEATANVDPSTDSLIQKTIREKFRECTVLTIAHRLHTIMDSDRVLVMDYGQAVEFEHPYLLLQNPDSLFSQMANQVGKSMVEEFTKISKKAYENRSTKNDAIERDLTNNAKV